MKTCPVVVPYYGHCVTAAIFHPAICYLVSITSPSTRGLHSTRPRLALSIAYVANEPLTNRNIYHLCHYPPPATRPGCFFWGGVLGIFKGLYFFAFFSWLTQVSKSRQFLGSNILKKFPLASGGVPLGPDPRVTKLKKISDPRIVKSFSTKCSKSQFFGTKRNQVFDVFFVFEAKKIWIFNSTNFVLFQANQEEAPGFSSIFLAQSAE